MTRLGVDMQALTTAAAQIEGIAAEFGQVRSRICATPGAEGAAAEVTRLLDDALSALAAALGRAQGDLQHVAGQLAATESLYARTEQALSQWRVPGVGGAG